MPWIRRSRLNELVDKAEDGDSYVAYGEEVIRNAEYAVSKARRGEAKLATTIHRQRCVIKKLKELLALHGVGQATRKVGKGEQQLLTATEIVRRTGSTIAAPSNVGGRLPNP